MLTRRPISVKAKWDQISHFIKNNRNVCSRVEEQRSRLLSTIDSKSQEDRHQGPTV